MPERAGQHNSPHPSSTCPRMPGAARCLCAFCTYKWGKARTYLKVVRKSKISITRWPAVLTVFSEKDGGFELPREGNGSCQIGAPAPQGAQLERMKQVSAESRSSWGGSESIRAHVPKSLARTACPGKESRCLGDASPPTTLTALLALGLEEPGSTDRAKGQRWQRLEATMNWYSWDPPTLASFMPSPIALHIHSNSYPSILQQTCHGISSGLSSVLR